MPFSFTHANDIPNMTTRRKSLQTYALTVVTDQRRRILQTDRNANHIIATLFRHRDARHFQLHGFVIMPDHIHALITPAIDHTTSRCVQLIKGGSSFLIGKPATGKIWQDSYHEHRIRDAGDFIYQLQYIANNPRRRSYPTFSHVHTAPEYRDILDATPDHLSADSI
jgi:putative transposase